jgi:glycosyltransferase involved in cell wall biosynthesis
MKISLIICTRNRANQLVSFLRHLENLQVPKTSTELVIVDNNSGDSTPHILNDFRKITKWDCTIVNSQITGLGHARNCGITASIGDVLLFTDDDCYPESDYFSNFINNYSSAEFQYGMGQILLYDETDDPRVANARVTQKQLIPAKINILPAGLIQGANMFFARDVFLKAGLFREDMGAGTDFPCEDIEMAWRASHFGYVGALLPGFAVYHHHGKKKNSIEAQKTVESYDYGRGAYYASLMIQGVPGIWEYWNSTFIKDQKVASVAHLDRLARELSGASKFFQFSIKKILDGNQA